MIPPTVTNGLGNVVFGPQMAQSNQSNSLWQYGYNCAVPYCQSNTHVFACDHVTTCKCGKSTRQAPTCAVCNR